nr:hypothetical protein [Brevibacillus laterosporus]
MHLQSIINGLWDNTWDISIDPGRDIEANTLLLDNSDVVYSQFPNNIFTLDRFPLQIVDNNKFGEVNIFYEKSLDNKSLFDLYNKEEEKFIRLFQLLWTNNSVWVETSLRYNEIESITNEISDDTKKIVYVIFILNFVANKKIIWK